MLPFTWNLANRAMVRSTISLHLDTTMLLRENGQTNVAAPHYFAQWPLFQPCSDENDILQVSLSDKLSNDQHNKHQHSTGTNAPSIDEMFFHHDRHIPNQRDDRYRDNKPSISRACWIFFKVMPHFIKFHYYCTPRLRFFICLLCKTAHPFQHCRRRNIKQSSYSIKGQSMHIQDNSKELVFHRPTSRGCAGKLMTALLTFVPLPVTEKPIFNCLRRTAFWTAWIHGCLLPYFE